MGESRTLKKNEELLVKGSFIELLLKLCLPAVVVILVMIIYNMADTYFIGQTNDPNKISAISVCMPVFAILSGIGTLFGVGGSTAISISLGQQDYERIKHITAFCSFGAINIGLLFFAIVFAFTEPICIFLGADENTLDAAIIYLRVFSFAYPFVIFGNTYGNILRADGEAATAMLANMAGTITNIVLDAIFILVFKWDVFGAALATVIGNILTVVLIAVILVKKKQNFIPSIKNMKWDSNIILPVLTLGLPMTFSTVLGSVSNIIQNRLMIGHGSICLAAQSVAGKFGMLITMLIMGFCMGMQPAISYNFGSKNYTRLNQIVNQLLVFSIAIGVGMALFIFVIKDFAIGAFIDNEEVIAYGRVFVLASVCVGPIYAVYQVCQNYLQATGKANYAILVSLLDKGLIYIPVLFIMDKIIGAYGIAFSHFVTMLISVIVAVYLKNKWTKLIIEIQPV